MLEGLQVLQIAHMLAQESLTIPGQTKRIFHLRAHGQNSVGRAGQRQRIRCPAPGTPHKGRCPTRVDKSHRIITGHKNVSIVQQEGIGKICQALQGLVVVLGDGLLRQIARGHHQGSKTLYEG